MADYTKYLQYLGHVDDTTREDMLKREAEIRAEVNAMKARLEQETALAKEDMKKKIAEAKKKAADEVKTLT